MTKNLPFPKSFPNKDEELFLKLLLNSDEDFPMLWKTWKSAVVFEDIDYATLRLLPLLYLRLKKFAIDDELSGRIKGVYRLAWSKNQLLLDAVKKIIMMCNEQDIPVLVLKGISLLVSVYKDTGARFMSDADILIKPEHVRRVTDLMIKNGWRFHNHSQAYLSKISSVGINKEITFMNERGIELDIHWKIFEDFSLYLNPFESFSKINRRESLANASLWEQSVLFIYGGAEYRVLSPEDMLIHVIVHGAEGNNHRTLRFVVDSIYIIRNQRVDWARFVVHLREFDCATEIHIAFSYLRKHFPSDIPESVAQQIADEPLSKRKIRKYYKSANKTIQYLPFGNFFLLWRNYWQYEPRGRFPMSVYYFADYLRKAWGLSRKREIPVFIFNKYKKRFFK